MGWLDGLTFSIKNVASEVGGVAAAAGAAAAGPGFSLDRDEAQAMLTDVTGILTDLQDLRNSANSLKQVRPPAQDPASVAYNASLASNGSGAPGAFDYGAGHVDVEIAYLEELKQRLDKALGKTEEADDQAATDASKAGAGPTGYAG
jgi:hypothetical protein